MSFKIFALQLAGKIKPVEKIEKQRETLWKDYQGFLKVDQSDELKEYLALESFINSSEFKKKKNEVDALRFKGSKEYNELAEFKKLQKAKHLKRYFKIAGSQDLKRFEEIVNSEKPKDFEQLKEYIGGEKFANDKREKKKEALEKKDKYRVLKSDSDIRFFLRFKKSSLYKNYLSVQPSNDLKKFKELKERTVSKEFQERKTYLEDKKKWEKTEEFQKQIRYEEIKKQPHIQKYFIYKNSTDFDFYKNWEVTFDEDFSGILNAERWQTVTKLAENIGENFSLPGDLHFFTSGANVKTGGKLTIEVKKEKVKGRVWQMPAGFLPVDFDYTSGWLSSVGSFGKGDEIFEAKIKFNSVKQLVSTFQLSGDGNSPMVNLLEMGMKNRLGISKLNDKGKISVVGLDISNLKNGRWYIFSVEKSGSVFIWKINETEVFRTTRGDINYPLYITVSTMVIHDVPEGRLPNNFEIEWIKCYRKR